MTKNHASSPVNPTEIHKYLAGVAYPVFREQILKTVSSNRADPEMMDSFKSLPDLEYTSPDAIIGQLEQNLTPSDQA